MLSPVARAVLTVIMWAMFLVGMLVFSLVLSRTMEDAIPFVLILFTVAGLIMSGFIWNWGQLPDESREAAKRNRLTLALRNLSDQELLRLRQRLSTGDLDDIQLARLLDESEASKAKRA